MKLKNSPFVIGIAGGTGSGKTTLAARLEKELGTENTANLAHDHYYKDQSALTTIQRSATNYDHPNAYDTDLLITHLKSLIQGSSIEHPVYDFIADTRAPNSLTLSPKPIVIVEGILIFTDLNLRDLFDLKIYVDTDTDLRLIRRIKCDMQEAGRDFDYIVDKYLTQVKPMHDQFVEPSKKYADVVIRDDNTQDFDLTSILEMIR